RLESGERAQEAVDVLEPRYRRRIQAEVVDALQEPGIGIAAPAILHPGEEPAPRLVIGLGVELVRLVDVQLAVGLCLLDEGRSGGGEPRRPALYARHAGSFHGSCCSRKSTADRRIPGARKTKRAPCGARCTALPRLAGLVAPGHDAAALGGYRNRVRSVGLERWDLDVLAGDHCAVGVQEIDGDAHRLRCNGRAVLVQR